MNVYQGNGSHIVRDASFPCTYEGCPYTTNNRNNWRVHRHMHKIRQTRQYGCEECDFTATHAEQLRDHVNSVHRGIKAYKCEKCDYVTGLRTNLLMHMKKPHLVCEYCHTFVITGKRNMDRHVKNMHARLHFGTFKDPRVPPMPQDNLPPVKIERGSKDDVSKPRDPNEEVYEYASVEEAKAHGLDFGSGFKLKTSKAAINWRARYHCKEQNCSAKWSISEKKYTDGSSSFLLRINRHHTHLSDVKPDHVAETKDYFSCDFNGCTFKTKIIKGLKYHKKSHKAEGALKTFICKWCDYSTTSGQYHLTLHVNSVHLNFKGFKCDFCGFYGPTNNAVTQHMEKNHKDEGFLYRCNQCTFTATWPTSLYQHKKQNHRGISAKRPKGPWICESCGFEANGYNGRQEVVSHILEKHPEVRTDKCNFCNFVTIGVLTLKVHMKIHKETTTIKCNQCDFESASKGDVIKHKKTVHGNPSNCVCELCGKGFYDLGHLRMHKAKCSGGKNAKFYEEPLPCDLCEFVSKEGKYKLFNHMRRQHSNMNISLDCQKCDFTTKTLKSINKHVKEHGGAPTVCRLCSFSAYHQPIFLAHFESVHETKCKFCDYETSNIKGLKAHMRRTHGYGKEELHTSICDRCGFVALDAIDLRRHIEEKHGILQALVNQENVPNDNDV